MQILNLIQGSEEWKAARKNYFTASDAPAALGVSKYKTRSDLIRERATGIIPDVDDATQRRFNDGHRFEALARPLAEEIIGEELSPITGADGKYSASFDGITFDGDVIFEHKAANEEIRKALSGTHIANVLSEHYCAQMEHQLMVSGAKRCLFMATTWDKDGNNIESIHAWYEPNFDLRARIVAGWEQFEKDVADFKIDDYMQKIAEKPKAEAIKALPSVFVQATGMVTASNLEEFKEAATTFIAAIKTELVSDQDFADAESTVKFCKEAEANLEATKAGVLAQMTTVDEVTRTLDHIAAQLRDKRLMLDKLVKSEKEARKLAIVSKAANDYTAHVDALEAETKPIRLNVNGPSFAEAIKGLKSLSSMQEKVDTALRDAKFAADTAAKDVRAKLAWCKESSAGFGFLFSDLSILIANNGMEAFQAIVTGRIAKHKADEAEKVEAERAKMEAAAKEKAEREAAAKLAEEEARIRAEERAKAQAEQNAQQVSVAAGRSSEVAQEAPALSKEPAGAAVMPGGSSATGTKGIVLTDRTAQPAFRPSDDEIIEALSLNFRVHESKVIEWLLDMDLHAASERMSKEFA